MAGVLSTAYLQASADGLKPAAKINRNIGRES
jgi:hypothetical protein